MLRTKDMNFLQLVIKTVIKIPAKQEQTMTPTNWLNESTNKVTDLNTLGNCLCIVVVLGLYENFCGYLCGSVPPVARRFQVLIFTSLFLLFGFYLRLLWLNVNFTDFNFVTSDPQVPMGVSGFTEVFRGLLGGHAWLILIGQIFGGLGLSPPGNVRIP